MLPNLLFCAFLIIHLQAQQPDQVIEFFRHGARGPSTDYDPQWSSSEIWQLTKVGMVQHYDLGKSLATKYAHLIADGYSPDHVYVSSSSSKRCIQSAMVHVSSLFRGLTSTLTSSVPKGMQDSLIAQYESLLDPSESSRGNYVPVRVDVATTGFTNLVFKGNNPDNCQVLQSYMDQNSGSKAMRNAWTTFQDPVQEANTFLSGSQKITSMSMLSEAYDAFIADKYDGKTLPGGISDETLIGSLGHGYGNYNYIYQVSQKAQRELRAFPPMKAIMDQLYNFRQGSKAKKLVFLSGHDSNLLDILSVFGVINADCLSTNYDDYKNGRALSDEKCQFPKFASNLVFEFYNDTTNPYAKVYYNDVILPLCNGQDTCSYDDLMNLMKTASGSYNLATWHTKCENEGSGLSTGAKIGIAVGAAVVAGIFIGVGLWLFLKKKAALAKARLNQANFSTEEAQA